MTLVNFLGPRKLIATEIPVGQSDGRIYIFEFEFIALLLCNQDGACEVESSNP